MTACDYCEREMAPEDLKIVQIAPDDSEIRCRDRRACRKAVATKPAGICQSCRKPATIKAFRFHGSDIYFECPACGCEQWE